MNKILRNGPDIEVAFASGAKRQRIAAQRDALLAVTTPGAPVAVPDERPPASSSEAAALLSGGAPLGPSRTTPVPEVPPAAPGTAPRGGLKALLRPVVAMMYRIATPALRPLAFRLRAHMTRLVMHDLHHLHHHSLAVLQHTATTLQAQLNAAQERRHQELLAQLGMLREEAQRPNGLLLDLQQADREHRLQYTALLHAQQELHAQTVASTASVTRDINVLTQRVTSDFSMWEQRVSRDFTTWEQRVFNLMTTLTERMSGDMGRLSDHVSGDMSRLAERVSGDFGMLSDSVSSDFMELTNRLSDEQITLREKVANEPHEPVLQPQQAHADMPRQMEHIVALLTTQGSLEHDAISLSKALLEEMQQRGQDVAQRLDRIEQYSMTSARRAFVQCAGDEVMVRTEVGYVLCAGADHAVLASLVDTGELERGTRLLIQRFLQPGNTFVDVGANVGMHTLAAGRAMQGRGKIIAFEPFEQTKRLLEKSVWLNGFEHFTDIHQAAVSDTAGTHPFFLGKASGHHSLFPVLGSSEQGAARTDVATVRLEQVVGSAFVDLIKIDVEGAELEVLAGAKSVIARNPDIALIVEFGPEHLRRTGHSVQDWLAQFTGLGLEYRVINPDTGLLEAWPLEALERSVSVNLFMAAAHSAAWAKAQVQA